MSSKPERPVESREKRDPWSYPLALTLIYAVIFTAGMVGLGALLWNELHDRWQEDWDIDYAELNRSWAEAAGLDEAQSRRALLHIEATARVHLGPDEARIFDATVIGLTLGTVLLAALCGAWLTRRAMRPVRRLTDTLNGILETGAVNRRVPAGRSGSFIYELIVMFNRMLERIDGLVRGMREALDSVAHDLRTPLTRLRAVAEQALQSAPDPDVQREALSDCMEESEQVLRTLATLMDVAEAETGAMRLRRESVDLRDLVGGVAELYELVADKKDVTLTMDVPDGIAVHADTVRLRQVLANLVDNAVKYTRPGGSVEVSARGTGDSIVIQVRDDGVGIVPSDLPRIFDRLYRGDSSRSERGLGLGLSYVRAIVHAHGGSVSVESAVNQGTTVRVLLPVADQPAIGVTAD